MCRNVQAQLRGMIGDYKGGDETVLAAALEVFDLLSNTLSEYQTAVSPTAAGSAAAKPGPGELPLSKPSSSQLKSGCQLHAQTCFVEAKPEQEFLTLCSCTSSPALPTFLLMKDCCQAIYSSESHAVSNLLPESSDAE